MHWAIQCLVHRNINTFKRKNIKRSSFKENFILKSLKEQFIINVLLWLSLFYHYFCFSSLTVSAHQINYSWLFSCLQLLHSSLTSLGPDSGSMKAPQWRFSHYFVLVFENSSDIPSADGRGCYKLQHGSMCSGRRRRIAAAAVTTNGRMQV